MRLFCENLKGLQKFKRDRHLVGTISSHSSTNKHPSWEHRNLFVLWTVSREQGLGGIGWGLVAWCSRPNYPTHCCKTILTQSRWEHVFSTWPPNSLMQYEYITAGSTNYSSTMPAARLRTLHPPACSRAWLLCLFSATLHPPYVVWVYVPCCLRMDTSLVQRRWKTTFSNGFVVCKVSTIYKSPCCTLVSSVEKSILDLVTSKKTLKKKTPKRSLIFRIIKKTCIFFLITFQIWF